jgi:integrase
MPRTDVQLAAAGSVQSCWGGEITAQGLRHSAATILLNHVGKDLRNPAAAPPQEYSHHRALYPRRLWADLPKADALSQALV